jgi:hypothetical protein
MIVEKTEKIRIDGEPYVRLTLLITPSQARKLGRSMKDCLGTL